MYNRLREIELEQHFQQDREHGSAQNADEAIESEEMSLWQRGKQALAELIKPKTQRRAQKNVRTSSL
jgi:hypothetical protein